MHRDSRRKSTTLLFLRHGQTDFPKDRFYEDRIEDPPLNRSGIDGARVWPTQLEKHSGTIAAVYVSPSRRTQETARIAAGHLDLPHNIVDGLGERQFGEWGGLTIHEVKSKFPDEWTAYRKDPVSFTPKGGESLIGFSKRANETIGTLLARHPGETVLVVSHAGQIRVIVAAALEIPLQNFKRLVVRNASITEIEYTDCWPNLHAFSFVPAPVNSKEER